MLFRLFNAPANFEKYIKKILVEKLDMFIIVYLNNILVYTKTSQKSILILFVRF